ncbi:MAG: M14 family zinc carboxypeptidase, partial [Actinomycetota bacterium]
MSYTFPMRRSLLSAVIGLVLVGVAAPPAATGPPCPQTPTYDAAVTSPQDAIPGWPFLRASTDDIVSYTQLVGSQSDRVRVGQFATSWNGTPLLYALVGSTGNIQRAEEIAAAQQSLRDPRKIRPRDANGIIDGNPAIVWYAGNVHGLETSGADAALQILYELAARSDCEVEEMLGELLIGIVPTQNPDGRDAMARTNAYGFDMNRDWFARTQPEIDGELDLLSAYPPVLFIDAHEMGSSDFFFPPNDDPIHHEITDQSLHWINDIYSPAIKAAFEERQQTEPIHWDYFNYETYDLFYMGYGDSAPTTGFTAAGMTFEKGTADPDDQREEEQFVAGWASLMAAADHKDEILRQYHDAHVQALAEGRRGELQPNHVVVPGNELRTQVPPLRIRNYFLRAGTAQPEVYHLIERLMDMGVEVYRLTRRARLPAIQTYGDEPRRTRLRKGTYWIPMAQPQKHWIQALL